MSKAKPIFNRSSKTLAYIRWYAGIARQSRLTDEFRTLLGRVVIAIFILSVVVVLEGIILWWVTPPGDSNISSPSDGIYFIVPMIFGETMAPHSLGERIVTLFALIQGLILTTYLIAMAAFFTVSGERILTRTHSGHYVICGWNFQGTRIIEELIAAREDSHYDIVVVPGDPPPPELKQFGSNIFVIEGSPAEDATLVEAGIKSAKSAIVLNDTNDTPESADAKVLMTTLAIETINGDVYTCAQIQHSENEVHLQRANVDEVIPLDMLGANLAVASALNPGVTKMISELVHFNAGSEFYKLTPPLPQSVIGQTFNKAQQWFSSENMILVAVESAKLADSYYADRDEVSQDSRGVSVNPHGHEITADDALFVISENAPELA
jgi:voltage-gated potassium channel